MSEKDLPQKLTLERFLWSAGYYTRTNVLLSAPLSGKSDGSATGTRRKRQSVNLTDLDVLGIRFLDDLTPRRVVGDCKSGNVSAIGRAFWLRGVMDHFIADRGYVVLGSKVHEFHKEAAANLSITLASRDDIMSISKRYNEINPSLRIGDSTTKSYLEDNLVSLPTEFDELRELRDTLFWYYSAPRAMSNTIVSARRISKIIDEKNKWHKAILLDTVILFSIACLSVCHELIRLSPEDLLGSLRGLMFGGPEGIARREQIIKTVARVVQQVSRQPEFDLGDSELLRLDPPYMTLVADLIARFISHPAAASRVPHYLHIRLVHGVLYDEWDVESLFGKQYSALADKLAIDTMLTFFRAADSNASMIGPRGRTSQVTQNELIVRE